MDKDDQQNHLISLRFMKVTGLYQLIDPRTPKHYGLNLYEVGAAVEFAITLVMISTLFYSSSYYVQDTNELMSHFMCALAVVFASIKLFYVRKNARSIWNCLEMTSFGFLSHEFHDRRSLRKDRSRSISVSSVFIVLWSFVVIAWCLSPFFFQDVYMTIESNGHVRRLRYNSLNIVYPVTEQFYNDNFLVFYFLDSIQIAIWGHVTILYDSFVVSMCIAIISQLRTIAESYNRMSFKRETANGESEYYIRP